MMKSDEGTGAGPPSPPPATEVVEVLLGLSPDQWSALEAVSSRRNLPVAQLARRAIADFLRRELEADGWSMASDDT